MNDCYTDYHMTLLGLVISFNINLSQVIGPIPSPLTTLSRGTIFREWIDNPVTWFPELHQFWFEDEVCYQYYSDPITVYHIIITPDQYGNVAWDGESYTVATEGGVWCPCDFNFDGFVDGNDLDAFITNFYQGCTKADFDGNGFVNGDDFDLFVSHFYSGC